MSHVTNISDDEVLELKRAFRQHDREGTGDVKIKQMRGVFSPSFFVIFLLTYTIATAQATPRFNKNARFIPPPCSSQNID